MYRWTRALACGILLAFLFQTVSFSKTCEGIEQSVLRVHILANSDSEEDQALKLLVRDAVVEAGAGLLNGVTDSKTARKRLQEVLPQLQQTAQKCVNEHGYPYAVNAEVTTMYFTTRMYGDYTLPAGNYDAVRITIGSGEGRNWWCVMYPPLCVSAATDKQSLEEVLNAEQQQTVKGGKRFAVRFKIVEWIYTLSRLFQ